MNIIQEENLSFNITNEEINEIYNRMDNCICKIKNKDKGYITGFFCNIKFPDKFNILPVLNFYII